MPAVLAVNLEKKQGTMYLNLYRNISIITSTIYTSVTVKYVYPLLFPLHFATNGPSQYSPLFVINRH